MKPFTELTEFPRELLRAEVADLRDLLGGPTLIHIDGERGPALFVSVLLHGNEHTSFYAVQRLMSQYREADRRLPRALSLFIGNVEAAHHNMRKMPDQPDYNRIWIDDNSPEGQMMLEVRKRMLHRGMFASIDVHNNTGRNPHYACVSKVDPQHMQLAVLFRRTVVHYTKPHGTQTVVFSNFTPSVTLECGFSAEPAGITHVCEYLDACLHLSEIPTHPVTPHDIDFYETIARLRIPDDASFAFDDEPEMEEADIILRHDLDDLNFSELEARTSLGRVRSENDHGLLVQDPDGNPLDHTYLEYNDKLIQTAEMLIPSMFTRHKEIIREDCLGYLMKPKPLSP